MIDDSQPVISDAVLLQLPFVAFIICYSVFLMPLCSARAYDHLMVNPWKFTLKINLRCRRVTIVSRYYDKHSIVPCERGARS